MTDQPISAEEAAAAVAQDQARHDGASAAAAAIAAGQDATYTAQPGDTFASIAAAIYGNVDELVAAALHFANAAQGAVSSDATILPPGTPLVVPAAIGDAAGQDASASGADAAVTSSANDALPAQAGDAPDATDATASTIADADADYKAGFAAGLAAAAAGATAAPTEG